MEHELKRYQRYLSPDHPESFESQDEDNEVINGEEGEKKKSIKEAFLEITLQFMRIMKQEELAESLKNSKRL